MDLKNILQFIEETDDRVAVDLIFDAAFDKKRVLYPDWHLEYLAYPRENREGHLREIRRAMDCMERRLAALDGGAED